MRCFFHLVNRQDTILDDTGIEVADLEMAKVQVRKAIAELRQDDESALEDWERLAARHCLP
jgi:hypothetical protein